MAHSQNPGCSASPLSAGPRRMIRSTNIAAARARSGPSPRHVGGAFHDERAAARAHAVPAEGLWVVHARPPPPAAAPRDYDPPMKMTTAALAILALAAIDASAAEPAPAAKELTALVEQFLAGASRNDVSVHERFWAEDLVYTRAAGERVTRADILRDVRAAAPPKPGEPAPRYSAEDVRVQQFGDTAVVAFRLVATTGEGASPQVQRFLNTGTFVRRVGRWQAVAWQATRMAGAPAAAAPSAAATPAPATPPKPDMGEFFLVLLKKGPEWTAEVTDKTKALQAAHMANIKAMWEAKKLIIAGPDGDDHDMRGVFVFAAKDRAEAQAFAESDPAVKAGRLVPEIHSWWVEKNALPEAGAYCR